MAPFLLLRGSAINNRFAKLNPLLTSKQMVLS